MMLRYFFFLDEAFDRANTIAKLLVHCNMHKRKNVVPMISDRPINSRSISCDFR